MTDENENNSEMMLFEDKEMMAFFLELHSGNPREGPGDNISTLRALKSIQNLPKQPEILDIGCGPGMQTLALALATEGRITALDFQQQYLNALNRSAVEYGLNEQIITVQGSMFELPFEPGSFDLIWSEGAIYIMGFEKGLREWRKFLRTPGFIAVTECCWLRDDIPENLRETWKALYPGMGTVQENLKIIESCNYQLLDHFTLPESSWWDGYYHHVIKGMERMRMKYPTNEKVSALLHMEEEEQSMYNKYSDFYGYEFFIMQKE